MTARAGLWLAGGLFLAAPVAAGATGAAYFAVIPFTGLFFLWVLIMRTRPLGEGPGFVLPMIVIHAAVASALLGLGQLVRALTGLAATVPLLVWLVLGLGALALGRLIWTPVPEAEVENLLERLLKRLNDMAGRPGPEEPSMTLPELRGRSPRGPNQPTAAETVALARAYGALDALPEAGTSEAELRAILLRLEDEVRSGVLLPALIARAGRTGTRRDRHGALILAADGAHAWRQIEAGRLAEVFDLIVAAADTATLARFLVLGNALLDDFPTTAVTFPGVPRLLEIAGQIAPGHPELADALVSLANRLEDLNETLND